MDGFLPKACYMRTILAEFGSGEFVTDGAAGGCSDCVFDCFGHVVCGWEICWYWYGGMVVQCGRLLGCVVVVHNVEKYKQVKESRGGGALLHHIYLRYLPM